jgi:cytoskeletal protein RodZ
MNQQDPPIILIGEFLKELRIRKGYSVERLSKETKISLNVLKKIEANDLKSLNSITYVKGFLQNCLKTLHTPYDDKTINIIYATYESMGIAFSKNAYITGSSRTADVTSPEKSTAPLVQPQITTEAKFKNRKNLFVINTDFFISPKFWLAVIAIASLWLVNVFIKTVKTNQVTNRYSEKPLPSNKGKGNIADLFAQTQNLATPTVTPSSTPTEIATPVVVSTATPTQIPTVEDGVNPYIAFKKIKTLSLSIDPASSDNANVAILPLEEKNKIVSNKQNIYIRCMEGESWISYKVDGNSPNSKLLKAGKTLSLLGDKIFINAGNTNGLKVFLNGHLVKYPYNKGVKSFIFPTEDASLHSLPLFATDAKGILQFYEDYMKTMKPESSANVDTPKQTTAP